MIIDIHGHYTTEPPALHAFRDKQLAGLADAARRPKSTDLGISDEIVNFNGGAIALGHPIGMSGNRIALTLLHELRRRGCGVGAAALCGGGGQGDAIIVKTV